MHNDASPFALITVIIHKFATETPPHFCPAMKTWYCNARLAQQQRITSEATYCGNAEMFVPCMQVPLPQVCAVVATFTAARRALPKVPPSRGPQAYAVQSYAQMCSVVISDAQRRFRDDADRTVFHAWELATLVEAAALTPDPDATFLNEAAGVATEHIDWAPGDWRLRDLSPVLAAFATHGLKEHRLFSVATRVCVQRLREAAEQPRDAAAGLGQAEGVVWAYAVTRRTYPYSSDAVSEAAAGMLEVVLHEDPGAAELAVVAQMLWSFAAMWKTPARLFAVAGDVIATRESDLNPETAMSFEWSFGRARHPLPAVVQQYLKAHREAKLKDEPQLGPFDW